MAQPIGILGGTFDPVHHGHLRLALEVFQSCALSEVRLLPLHTPPHRQMPATSPEQRLQMLRLAIQEVKCLQIDERELQRADVSFTVDSLRSLREEVGQQSLCLIMGMDAFQTLNTWYKWTALLDYAHIVVVRRPGVELQIVNTEVSALYNNNITTELSDLHVQAAGKILEVETPELDISSTRIRELIGTKQDAHYLLPEKVVSYIKQEGLYHRYK